MEGADMPEETTSQRENRLGTLGAALIHALTIALEELAQAHGAADLGWLDELQDRIIRHVESVKFESMGVKEDAPSVRAAVETIRVVFTHARAQLRQARA